jgi:hypothetical protein
LYKTCYAGQTIQVAVCGSESIHQVNLKWLMQMKCSFW